ncbi:hypothetical protein LOK49_LG09G00438 [Camellia lanceoleosa]|uniref:Uncharacterized protein n=1 Tax=Camellia lanceoleosa TaxID=1840588 RepID=A0ACC0GGI2_9ERIC|nr:hypothetical protein LOK49_LG09G00438 [Camellia lanceoleosa]
MMMTSIKYLSKEKGIRVEVDDGLSAKGFGLPGKLSNVKVILNGGQWVTFLKPDGYLSLYPTAFMSCIET